MSENSSITNLVLLLIALVLLFISLILLLLLLLLLFPLFKQLYPGIISSDTSIQEDSETVVQKDPKPLPKDSIPPVKKGSKTKESPKDNMSDFPKSYSVTISNDRNGRPRTWLYYIHPNSQIYYFASNEIKPKEDNEDPKYDAPQRVDFPEGAPKADTKNPAIATISDRHISGCGNYDYIFYKGEDGRLVDLRWSAGHVSKWEKGKLSNERFTVKDGTEITCGIYHDGKSAQLKVFFVPADPTKSQSVAYVTLPGTDWRVTEIVGKS